VQHDDKKLRKYGYDLLINNFEPLIRRFLINEIFLPSFGIDNWIANLPSGVTDVLSKEDKIAQNNKIEEYFDELYLWCLKEIIIQKNIYPLVENLLGKDLSKEKFISIMDEINEHRRKIAHAKSNYTFYDFEILSELVQLLCKGEYSSELINYIKREGFKSDIEIPNSFYESNPCLNNLPIEDYDLDGGYVGRKNEIKKIKKLLYSNQDRIITITGAGGLGKTAITLKCAYSILSDNENPYKSIVWFSAKENKLTSENGIVSIKSQISDYFTILKDILQILDSSSFTIFEQNKFSEINYKDAIYAKFENSRMLLIIDNLETITDEDIIEFIKDIPRPSQVLITSRKGLGEIERRYPLPDFPLSDAVQLFRILSKERNKEDLLKLPQLTIETFIKSVSSYPLLIKWSIGKICLGMDINKAFTEIHVGNSEISQFVFNDIFGLLSDTSKKCLYSMIVFGEKGISRHLIQHMTNLNEDIIDDSLEELIVCSFIYPETKDENGVVKTYYQMLLLTRGFVQNKLDNEKVLQRELHSKYTDLSLQIERVDKSKSEFHHTLSIMGINTEEDKVAFNHIKTAKNYIRIGNPKQALSSFHEALRIAPNFAYLHTELGRFESSRSHFEDAEKHYKKACQLDTLNYRCHFEYGVFLRKQNRIDDSIFHLLKTEELNPEFPAVYNELGRALSFQEEFEKADEKFEKSEKLYVGDFINFKHLNITLYYRCDNYKRWAEKFFHCQDFENGKRLLLKSYETIKKANSINPYDEKNFILEKTLTKDIGIRLIRTGNQELGKKYLIEATIPSDYLNKNLTVNVAISSYIFLAENFSKYSSDKNEAISYLLTALELCVDERTKIRILQLKESLENISEREGIIKFFNVSRNFGLIEDKDGIGFVFIRTNINTHLSKKEVYELDGKRVSFHETMYKGKPSAISINIIS
jgi:LuxR family transcriptional regulator, glucitol operon activator